MGFSHFARGVYLVIEDNHRTFSPCIRRDADAGGVEEVSRSVEVFFGRIALRANKDDRLVTIYSQIEKIGCLLECVSAMGNNDPGDLGPGQFFTYGFLQCHPAIRVHITGRDI